MDTPISSLSIAWIGILFAPPVAIGTFFITSRHRPAAMRRLSMTCVLLMALVAAAACLDVSFTSVTANTVCWSAAYFSYCFLAISAWRLRRLAVRIPVLMVAALPVAVGYLLGTVGMLGLMFILDDYTRPPMQTTDIAHGLECRVTSWGMAASDSGYTVHIYRHWALIPLLEREVARIVINQSNPQAGLQSASCDDALKLIR
ncbi:hypothetical protein ACG04R_06845 [Roseateles sp. BYS78W]|uniref:Uncharacterized protein n=1 Tax=Pelomonas candidula TaxID=3299025 RepID=A0ABW7H902_9BURK